MVAQPFAAGEKIESYFQSQDLPSDDEQWVPYAVDARLSNLRNPCNLPDGLSRMNYSTQPQFSSSPMRALRSSIDSPNWGNNLLWLTIAALLNALFIGQIGLFGYGAELIAKRAGLPGKPTVDIDTNRLGDYIEKGIWPFVVHLLVQFALGLIIFIPVGLLVAIFLGIGAAVGGDEFAAFAVVMAVPILAFLAVVAAIGSVPFLIRAMVCQDFQQSFDLSWCLGFVRLMFWEILVSALVYWLLSMCTIILGLLMLCLGYFPAIGMVSGGAMHLVAQWYEVYLSRGGVAVLAAGEQVIDAVEI